MADNPTRPESLPLDPALFQLPLGFASTGDPVELNPFPAGSGPHEMWARATRIAEEKVARVKADWLVSQQALNSKSPRTIDEMEQFTAIYGDKHRELLTDEFEVWAERAAQVVLTDADVRQTDAWLVGYADALLESNARLLLKLNLPRHLVEIELRWMREQLAALVQHYKAEIRRCRTTREEEMRQLRDAQAANPVVGSVGVAKPAARPQRTFPLRAKWLLRALDDRKWTPREFERQGGPHAKTTRKVVGGKGVSEAVLEKIAQVLSKKGRHVTITDIPRD